MSVCVPAARSAGDWQSTLQLLKSHADERRSDGRSGFDFRLRLTPLDGDIGRTPLVVVGRDISGGGVGFSHSDPLPYRRVLLEADDARLADLGLGDLALRVVLRWCRFISAGHYESGGRIARVADLHLGG
ncbi:MAG: hypothetical protein AAF805_09665 [Planctomycetota bacterium]